MYGYFLLQCGKEDLHTAVNKYMIIIKTYVHLILIQYFGKYIIATL